jgi:ankyrin repeat protein
LPDSLENTHSKQVLQDLRDGVHKTETDPFHVLLYKKNTITTRSEWKELLTNVYIWYDWFSQPQPSRGTSKDETATLNRDLILALDSVSAYVERADTLMILAPSSVHTDIVHKQTGKKTYTCYRTWRRRGFCVLEFFCANLSRRSTHPVLLVRSVTDAPIWISSQECLKLAVGECNFTCCEMNHLGHEGDSKMKCSRKSVKIVMSQMIDAKAKHLFMMKSVVHGRFTRVLKHWWLRGLDENGWMTPFSSLSRESLKDDLKTWLDWDKNIDGTFFDREGISLLFYAVSANHFEAVSYLLTKINKRFKNHAKERQRRIESRCPKSGFLDVGMPGSCTTLMIAMGIASPRVVELLLKNGTNPYVTEINGNNPLMYACAGNRVDNVKFWLKQFPDWDLQARNSVVGGCALGITVFMGPNRLALTKLLLESGANIIAYNDTGGFCLTDACSNEDCDPNVVRFLLNYCSDNVNTQIRARTLKWKLVRFVAKTAVRIFKTSNGLFRSIAIDDGSTALHYATMRGDTEIVELLLSKGSDPYLKNGLGLNVSAMCITFPELREIFKKYKQKRTTKFNK